MAARKPLYMTDTAWTEEMTTSDSMTLGGLTLGGNLVMGSNKITGLANGTDSGDAINKSQLDLAILYGGHVKELVLHKNQLVNAEGVLAAIALVMDDQPVSGDTIIITNGTTTRTYGAATGGDVQYAIGGTLAATMGNLATAITGDATGAWDSDYSSALTSIDADGAVVIYELDSAAVASKLYGTWATPANCKVVNYYAETEYSKITKSEMPGSLPANTNFGFHRLPAAVIAGEIHWAKADDVAYYWDDDTSAWVTMSGAGSIIEATAASGGGVKGKATYDSNYGLSVASGVVKLDIAASNPGLQFATGDLQVKPNTAKGVTVSGDGIETKVDGTTITYDGSGNMQAIVSNEAPKIENTMTASEAIAIGDPVYQTGTVNKVGKADASTDAKSYVIGIARTAATNDGDPVEVCTAGTCAAIWGGTGTTGSRYFLQPSHGIGTGLPGAGKRVIEIGVAKNTNDMFVRIIDWGKQAA